MTGCCCSLGKLLAQTVEFAFDLDLRYSGHLWLSWVGRVISLCGRCRPSWTGEGAVRAIGAAAGTLRFARPTDAGSNRANNCSYWKATSVKLRSLRECSRSRAWDLSFSSA